MKTFPFVTYLICIAVITVMFGVTYASVQQVYRTGADDPQVQMANDINTKLQQGKSIDNFFSDTINISKSLSPFVVLYDKAGKPLRSSGFLNGKPPELPSGVFDFTKLHGEHRVTWQAGSGVRMAMVVINSNPSPVGFIATGRSLKEVEIREHNLMAMLFFGWIISIALLLLHALWQFYTKTKFIKNENLTNMD